MPAKPKAIPVFLIVAACLVCSTARSQSNLAPEVVRIQIDPRAGIAHTTDNFVGLGYETSAVARQGYFSPQNRLLVQLYKTLSPHGLIRIGGNVSDYAKYVPDGIPAAVPEHHTTVFNKAELTDLGAFARKTGWQVMWGLNLKTGTDDEAVAEAVAVQKALGNHLHSFEIGNETDLQPQFKNKPEAYLAAYRQYKSAIRAALPGAAFSGPDAASGVHWVQSFAREESTGLKLLTRHYYRGGAGDPASTIAKLLASDLKWQQELDGIRGISTSVQVPYRINEINSFFGGGKKGVSDTFASALWCLDNMLVLAAHGCQGVNMETDINQLGWVSHYSPIYRDETGQLIVRPCYYGMLAFSIAGVGDMVKTGVSDTDANVTAYAVKRAHGELWVTVINKDLAKTVQVELSLPPGYSTAREMRLTAPSAEGKDHVTLAGAEVSAKGTWKAEKMESLSVENRTASFSLPNATAALIPLR